MKKSFLSKLADMFSNDGRKNKSSLPNGILLFLTFIIIFVIPAFPIKNQNLPYTIAITGIFLFSVLSLKRDKKSITWVSIFLTMAIWVTFISDYEWLRIVFRGLIFLFFIFIVFALIRQVSLTSSVTDKVIVDSISAYLMLGFAFSLIVAIVSIKIDGAYNTNYVNLEKGIVTSIREHIYYTFMTFTTTGYGDVVPTHPISKSLAILISVSGQLYVGVIIAMLVGKYASKSKPDNTL